MSIRKMFKTSWVDAVMTAAMDQSVDIFPEGRIIRKSTSIGPYELGDVCCVYGDSEYPQLITSRFQPDAILVPALFHVLEQIPRLRAEGIKCKLIRESGLIQCDYTKQGSAYSVSGSSSPLESSQEQSPQTTSEVLTE